MSINYNKLMEELDNCLGLEKSSIESIKKPVAKVNKAFEGYDDVENELAQEMGLPASETSEDELVFSEEVDQPEVSESDEPSKEEIFREVLTNLFSELCENSKEEEARETIKNLVKETICGEDSENCEDKDKEDLETDEEEPAEESAVSGQSLTDRLLALANGDSATEDLDNQDTPVTENKESVGDTYDGSDSAFEALCSKMINRYNSLASKSKKTSTATEGQQEMAPKLDEQALNQVSMEFQYSGKNLRKIVTEAISKGVI